MRIALAIVMTLAACSSNGRPPHDQNTADRMLDHFFALSALERAVAHGDVAGVRDNARALAEPRKGDPKSWAPRVTQLQKAARAVEGQPVDKAAGSVVAILEVCAGCHRDLGVDVTPVSIPDPPGGEGIQAKMRRHEWGMDLLRVAVVFDKKDIWDRGVSVLTDAPLDPAELAESGVINPKTIGFARTLRTLAGGAKLRPKSEWFQVYEGMLGTCVGCHAE